MVESTRGAKHPSGPIGGDVGSVSWDMYGIFNEKVGVSPAEQEAAKKFLKFILTGKTATDFALTVPGHLIPPHLDTPNFVFKDAAGKLINNPTRPLLTSEELEGLGFPDREVVYDAAPLYAESHRKVFVSLRGCPMD
jgi:hypothetical protein